VGCVLARTISPASLTKPPAIAASSAIADTLPLVERDGAAAACNSQKLPSFLTEDEQKKVKLLISLIS
jgi:hypothetical protein